MGEICPEHYESIRPQECSYQKQIKQCYKDCLHLFVTHCSDNLHLEIQQRLWGSTPYKGLIARSGFKKYDMISEIRGSIISYKKLLELVNTGTVQAEKLPTLLYLNHQSQLVISPKNITKYLFDHPANRNSPSQICGKTNCYIQSHFGSKLFAIASRDIEKGQELILEQMSFKNTLYRFSREQF